MACRLDYVEPPEMGAPLSTVLFLIKMQDRQLSLYGSPYGRHHPSCTTNYGPQLRWVPSCDLRQLASFNDTQNDTKIASRKRKKRIPNKTKSEPQAKTTKSPPKNNQ